MFPTKRREFLIGILAGTHYDAAQFPRECIGENGQKLQRGQCPAELDCPPLEKLCVAVLAEAPVAHVVAVGPQNAVGKTLFQLACCVRCFA